MKTAMGSARHVCCKPSAPARAGVGVAHERAQGARALGAEVAEGALGGVDLGLHLGEVPVRVGNEENGENGASDMGVGLCGVRRACVLLLRWPMEVPAREMRMCWNDE